MKYLCYVIALGNHMLDADLFLYQAKSFFFFSLHIYNH